MKISYRKKLFFSFLLIFALFTVGIIVFEQNRERTYKTEALEEKLDAYAQVFNEAYRRNVSADTILTDFPPHIRVSVIDNQGFVIYDNTIKDVAQMENHANRPEIKEAQQKQKGHDIRTSSSTHYPYLYYARYFGNYYVRVALPYDVQVRNFLKADNMFLYYIIALFVFGLILIHYVSGRFGKSIRKLDEFTSLIENGTLNLIQGKIENYDKNNFSNDELGKISKRIAQNYEKLQLSEAEILRQKEKLLQHVHSSEEGICFFASDKTVEFYNGLFFQYLNTLITQTNSTPLAIFSDPQFAKIEDFLSHRTKEEYYFETKIEKQGKIFMVRVNVFENGSFEIMLNDITKETKNRLLKQEMTGNIAHELRTPITGMRGCLETILENQLPPEKERYFIQQAYEKSLALSELIQDMSLLTKIEDAPQSFQSEQVNIPLLLKELQEDFATALQEKEMTMQWNMSENLLITGNSNLLYAIFRNLTDNAIRYAGHQVQIQIDMYKEDNEFYYFSYSDNGVGIADEQHLNRLFERFYRISEGRTRDSGGSGLGLSIVKNAVLFHKGSIAVKNGKHKDGHGGHGGLEFLFTIQK